MCLCHQTLEDTYNNKAFNGKKVRKAVIVPPGMRLSFHGSSKRTFITLYPNFCPYCGQKKPHHEQQG